MEIGDLGLTKEQIFEGVVNKVSADLLHIPVRFSDEDGGEYEDFKETPFQKELREQIKKKIDSTIETIVEKHVLPNAEQHIKNLVLQETNKWGEPKGESLTFVEYLTKQAENFMLEEVNYEGKPKGYDSFSWHKKGTRIEYMIHKYLQYHIEEWAKEALKTANKTIVDGLQKAVEIKLQELLQSLKIGVTTK